MKKARVAILASGSGTTAEAFIRSSVSGAVAAEVIVVVCNVADAGVFERIAHLNSELSLDIKTKVINSRTNPVAQNETFQPGTQTTSEQQAILDLFEQLDINLVLLLGYMKRVGPILVNTFGWKPTYTSIFQAKMINTHPGLLPETKGLYGIHVQEHVLAKKLKVAGQTLHIVSDNYDDGPTVAENTLHVLANDTPESLFARVQVAEKTHIGPDIHRFIVGRYEYNHRKEP